MYLFCTDAGQTTSVVNLTDRSSSVVNFHAVGTTEATLYNSTAALSSNFSNSAVVKNESSVIGDIMDVLPHYLEICPSRVHCDKLGADCIDCEFNSTCRYGANVSIVCHVKPQIVCLVCAHYMATINN